jgi:hypothetical protein
VPLLACAGRRVPPPRHLLVPHLSIKRTVFVAHPCSNRFLTVAFGVQRCESFYTNSAVPGSFQACGADSLICTALSPELNSIRKIQLVHANGPIKHANGAPVVGQTRTDRGREIADEIASLATLAAGKANGAEHTASDQWPRPP